MAAISLTSPVVFDPEGLQPLHKGTNVLDLQAVYHIKDLHLGLTQSL